MDIVTALLVSTAVGVLAWGFYRARLLGKLGILAWLQSVVLFAPWLLTFSLVAVGITINVVATLFLLLVSIAIYVILGNRLRAAASQEAALSQPSQTTDKPAYQSDAEPPGPDCEIEPAQLVPHELLSIPATDLKLIQAIFGLDTFFVTETIPYQEGAIFKGNLRGEPEDIYAQLSHSLQAQLAEQYRLFLVENQDGKPVVIVLPSRNDPQPTSLAQKVSAGLFLLLTVFTSLEASALLQQFDLLEAPGRWLEALPISVGLLSTLAIHELGHWLLARRHSVRLSPPFLIPAWQIGSFGAITQFKSLLPNRKVLFDVAVAGPAAGGILSLVLLVIGFLLSQSNSLFQIPTPFFQGSILVGTLARIVLGSALQQPLVSVHPLVVVGWLGLVITALNLLPAGRLDGGRIIQAIYGRKIAGRATVATLLLLAIASLANPLALYWAVVILFLQREPERPSLNELSEPDDARAALGLLSLFLMVATLLPLTPAIAGRLGIGG